MPCLLVPVVAACAEIGGFEDFSGGNVAGGGAETTQGAGGIMGVGGVPQGGSPDSNGTGGAGAPRGGAPGPVGGAHAAGQGGAPAGGAAGTGDMGGSGGVGPGGSPAGGESGAGGYGVAATAGQGGAAAGGTATSGSAGLGGDGDSPVGGTSVAAGAGGAGKGGEAGTPTAGTSGNAQGGGGGTGGGECAAFGPFASPEPITGLEVTGEQWGPTLSADGLTLYFSVWDGSMDRIYRATREDRGTRFSPAVVLEALRAGAPEATPFLSFDGLTLYFVSTRPAGGDRDLWYSQRTDLSAQFQTARQMAAANSNYDDQRPWVTRDELTLLFVSARPQGQGALDIWMASRDSRAGIFSAPANLPVVNGPSNDESPVMSADGRTLYFASSRSGGLGERDVWVATRPDTSGDFGSIAPVPVVNSAQTEVDLALSHDGRELFFVSTRSGTPEIWRSIRNCED